MTSDEFAGQPIVITDASSAFTERFARGGGLARCHIVPDGWSEQCEKAGAIQAINKAGGAYHSVSMIGTTPARYYGRHRVAGASAILRYSPAADVRLPSFQDPPQYWGQVAAQIPPICHHKAVIDTFERLAMSRTKVRPGKKAVACSWQKGSNSDRTQIKE